MSDRLLCPVPCYLCRTTLSSVSQSDIRFHNLIISLSLTDRVSKFYSNNVTKKNCQGLFKVSQIVILLLSFPHTKNCRFVTMSQSHKMKTEKVVEGLAPYILNLSISLRWVFSFTLFVTFLIRKEAPSHWIGDWVGPGAVMEMAEERKSPTYTGNWHFSRLQLATVLTELSKLICIVIWELFSSCILV